MHLLVMLDIGKNWNSIAFVFIISWRLNPIYVVVSVDVYSRVCCS